MRYFDQKKTILDELCPVCGYNVYKEIGVNPWEHGIASDEICPSCGIQYGYDDVAGGNIRERKKIYIQWRKKWIASGPKWYSSGMMEPENWNPKKQLTDMIKLY